MKKDDFVDLMGGIDDNIINEVDGKRQKNKKQRKRMFVTGIAACLALMFVAAAFVMKPWNKQNEEEVPLLQADSEQEQNKTNSKENGSDYAEAKLASFPSEVSARLQLLDFRTWDETLSPSVAPGGG